MWGRDGESEPEGEKATFKREKRFIRLNPKHVSFFFHQGPCFLFPEKLTKLWRNCSVSQLDLLRDVRGSSLANYPSLHQIWCKSVLCFLNYPEGKTSNRNRHRWKHGFLGGSKNIGSLILLLFFVFLFGHFLSPTKSNEGECFCRRFDVPRLTFGLGSRDSFEFSCHGNSHCSEKKPVLDLALNKLNQVYTISHSNSTANVSRQTLLDSVKKASDFQRCSLDSVVVRKYLYYPRKYPILLNWPI